MKKAEQRIQSEDIRNAFIFTKWNDIYNVNMNKLAAILASVAALERGGGLTDSISIATTF